MSAMQNVEFTMGLFQGGLVALDGFARDRAMQNSYYRAVEGYQDLAARYDELAAVSEDVVSKLQKALEKARNERDVLQYQLNALRKTK
ncbi:MAG: hypothetical protein Q7K57_52330 [Burkholderiaceae bacterium]|nr:hypothetical protein [Burkholderiaceae bacterium]